MIKRKYRSKSIFDVSVSARSIISGLTFVEPKTGMGFLKSRFLITIATCFTASSIWAQDVSEDSICFDNPNNYTAPHIHLWDANPAGAIVSTDWSGHAMEVKGGFYCYDAETSVNSINVIFNDNGGAQTGTLGMVSPNACYANGNWQTLEGCGLNVIPEVRPVIAATNICFDNPNNYAIPKVHMWDAVPAGAIPSTDWSGENMTTQGNFVCYDPGVTVTSLNVIFNDNGNQQTGTLGLVSPNNCYENGAWKSLVDCGFDLTSVGLDPVADAGADINILVGESAQFNASGSSDPDGSITDYSWSNGLTGVAPSLVYNQAETTTVTLTVTDDSGLQATDTVTVTVSEPPTPIADTAICFSNPNNYFDPHIYMWDITPGSVAEQVWPGFDMTESGDYYCYDPGESISAMNVIFNDNGAPQTGTLTFEPGNHCWDGAAWKTLSACGFITGGGVPPVADAGSDIVITAGETAFFDGSNSSDADGTIVTYAWDNGLSTATGSVAYNQPDTSFTVTLTVTDNDGFSDTDTVNVTVNPVIEYNYPTGKAVFYHNANNWTNPSAHLWASVPDNSTAATEWPGHDMTAFGAADLWFVDISDSTVSGNIIFSDNGNNQTETQNYAGDALCYKNGGWMTLIACGVPEQVLVEAGPNRTVNQGATIALSAAASQEDTSGAIWTSPAWSGGLVGASVVTPLLNDTGVFEVTMTLVSGNADSFQLSVVTPTQGLAERPLLAAPLAFPLSGDVDPSNYAYELAFPNLVGFFVSPVMVTNDGLNQDLIYVVDKPGQLFVFPNDPNVTVDQVRPLLPADFHKQVREYNEQGLLSVAFHPDFENNRLAYLFYIDHQGNSAANEDYYATDEEFINNSTFDDGVLVRVRLDDAFAPNGIEANSMVEVLRIPSSGADHKGGMMQFHPQTGEFFMSIGEMGYGETAVPVPNAPPPARVNGNAQDLTTLAGSFIRVNMLEGDTKDPVTDSYYTIPGDNPFVGQGGGVREEIWSYGHRNPWRWIFDTVADPTEAPENEYLIWEAEIGQDGETRYEEVNIIRKGENYGWPICEGERHRGAFGGDPNNTRTCTNDLIGPVSGYGNEGGSSIIGGFVYRGNKLTALHGKFLFADYVESTVWTIKKGEQKEVISSAFLGHISSFGTDLSGDEIFISTHGKEFGGASEIYRVELGEAGEAAQIPTQLSQTGIFADLNTQVPSHGVIEYDINSHGWFDGAVNRHFVAIPNGETIDVTNENQWDLPVGSVLVKHLDLPVDANTSEPFETSVLFRQENGNWVAANYEWNAQGTDATLVEETRIGVMKQQWVDGALVSVNRTVRAGASCDSCHTGDSAEPRDMELRQLNRDFAYPGLTDNQASVFSAIGLLNSAIASADTFVNPADTSADLQARALTYLDTNCSGCHGGDDTDPNSSVMDYRFDTPLADRHIMNQGSRLIPFDHAASAIYIQQTSNSLRMPFGSALTNPVADALMSEWIAGLAVLAEGPTSFQLSSDHSGEVAPGSLLTFTATSTYSNGFVSIPETGVDWQSSEDQVVAVTGTSGSLTAVAAAQGQTVISAQFDGNNDSLVVIVNGGPASPTLFSASASSSSAINLSWVDNASDEQNYILRRSDSAEGPFDIIATLAANTTQYLDTDLLPVTRYYYSLQAANVEGSSATVFADDITDEPIVIDALSIVSGVGDLSMLAGESRQVVAVADIAGKATAATVSSSWSSDNDNVATVSAGLITAGNSAGTAIISAVSEGVSNTITVTNLGAGEYVYFKKPGDWAAANIWIWSKNGGVETNPVVNGWPGDPMTPAVEYGGEWYRYPLLDSMIGSDDNLVNLLFNCGNGCDQTENLSTPLSSPEWKDNPDNTLWLTQAPLGSGALEGSQVGASPGEVYLAASGNLSTRLFVPGSTLDLAPGDISQGRKFLFWQGPGSELLVDPKNPNTKMVVGGALSYSLSAINDVITDDYVSGRDFYNDNFLCSTCHGADGAVEVGSDNKTLLNIADRFSLADLTTLIETTMPLSNPVACTGACANDIAEMLLAQAFFPPDGLCNLSDLEPQNRSFRLLSREEYNNSIRDLFDLGLQTEVNVTDGVPSDVRANGFLTNADMFYTTNYAAAYINAAELAVNQYVSNIYNLSSCNNNDVNCFIDDFGKKAFRRPVETIEFNSLKSVHDTEGDNALLIAILSSPSMLLRSELGELISSGEHSGYYQLTDYEIAANLSYTYWASTPSEAMMQAADAGELHTAAQISTMLESMLADPRADASFERFVDGWLRLYLSNPVADNTLSPSLKAAMREETISFVRNMVFDGATYYELMTAGFSYMNQDLANHYGLAWPGGSGVQQVFYPPQSGTGDAVPNSERRGLLGHGSILTVNSGGTKTHPIKRGLYVRRSLLCQDFGAPPLGAELSPVVTPDMTVRMRFEESHQAGPDATPDEIEEKKSCNFCHQHIDGIGFGFENYNHLGLWVTEEIVESGATVTIDSSGEVGSLDGVETVLLDGAERTAYQGIDELAELIAGSGHGRACYARQWFRYTRGLHEEGADSCTLEAFSENYKNDPNATLFQLMIDYTQTSNFSLRK